MIQLLVKKKTKKMPHPSGYLFAYSKGSQVGKILSWHHVPFHKGFKLAEEGFKVSRKRKYLINISLRISQPRHHEHSFLTINALVNNKVIDNGSHTFRIPKTDRVRLSFSFIKKLRKGDRLKFEVKTHRFVDGENRQRPEATVSNGTVVITFDPDVIITPISSSTGTEQFWANVLSVFNQGTGGEIGGAGNQEVDEDEGE